MNEIVITGIGIVSDFANSLDDLYKLISTGEKNNANITYPKKRKGLLFADEATKKLCLSCDRAMQDCGIEKFDAENTGIFIANAMGTMKSASDFNLSYSEKGFKAVMPMNFINTVMNAPAGYLAITYGITGMNLTVSNGSAAGMDAVFCCMDMIEDKRIKLGIVGGIEQSSQIYDRFINENNNKPSDGGCIFILEDMESADKQSGKIYAKLINIESVYFEELTDEKVQKIMQKTVSDAGFNMSDIEFTVSNCDFLADYNLKQFTGELYGVSGTFLIAAAVSIMKNEKHGSLALAVNVGFDGYVSCCVIEDIG